jgi:Galactose oxidase, central domain
MRAPARRRGLTTLLTLGLLGALLPAPPPAAAAPSNTWTVTGAPVQAPGYETATRLADGRVLATGGQGTRAELYLPSNGTWRVAGDMKRSRSWATATKLPSGKVLVVGGWTGSSIEATTELYDPATDRWTLTGTMGTPRMEHTATLLADGTVLVAGGKNQTYLECGYYTCPPIASAEIYDPSTGQWRPTGAMTKARALFTTTLLTDGTALAASWGQSDLYDPATGRWTAAASLPTDINSYAAVRLTDGRVMSTGGVRNDRTAATIYNPVTGSWHAAASVNIDRYNAPWAMTLLADGRVLVVGGNSFSRYAEVWDPAAGFWTVTGQMSNARLTRPGVALLADGRVLVEGSAVQEVWCDVYGDCWYGPLNPAEIYTP